MAQLGGQPYSVPKLKRAEFSTKILNKYVDIIFTLYYILFTMKRRPTKMKALRMDTEDRRLLAKISERLKLTESDVVRIAVRRMAAVELKEPQGPNAAD